MGLECWMWDWDVRFGIGMWGVGIWMGDGYGMGYREMGYRWDGLWIWDHRIIES